MSKILFAGLLALLLVLPALSAGSYDLVDFVDMTSTHRVIIGLPADHWDGDDSPRVKHRKASIMKMVDEHIERASQATDSLTIDALQYAYVTELEVAYVELFPKHTKPGARAAGLEEVPGTPALKLINVDTKESMYPDWPILLKDFPAEVDRLVADYERWQSQTNEVAADPEDNVAVLHQVNLAAAASKAKGGMVAMFYAPWCHYSKLMLPKYAGARALVGKAESQGLLEPGHVVLGKVNVDQEGDLRQVYNISTYPTLKIFISKSSAKAAPSSAPKGSSSKGKRNKYHPAAPFEAGMASGTEVASHALSSMSWAKKGRSFAVLGNPDNSKDHGVAYDSMQKFTGLAKLVDAAFVADAEEAADAASASAADAAASTKRDESDPSPAEARRVVTALAVFPDEQDVDMSARVAATARVASLVAGGSVFVAACSASEAGLVLEQLPGGTEGDQEVSLAAMAEAGKTSSSGGGGRLLVVSPGNGGILSYPLSAVLPSSSSASSSSSSSSSKEEGAAAEKQAAVVSGGGGSEDGDSEAAFEALRRWVLPATWPLVSRFDPSAAQGERIRSGVVTSLMVLVGDESDFMFEDFKESMLATARSHVGQAHFLYADASTEPRIAPLLRAARAVVPGSEPNAPPVVVLVSMVNAYRPRKLEGSAISAERMGAILEDAAQEATAAAEEEDEKEEPLVLKKGKKNKKKAAGGGEL